jgi:AcrR family transcriptional regulator
MNSRSTAIRRRRAGPRVAARTGRPRSSLRGAVVGVIRAAILDAAERAFGELGFADARMTDVAERAGVAAGTLYNYFDSKETIFRALVEHRADEFMGALEATAAEPRPALEQLARITEATFAYIESHAGMFMLFEQVGGHSGGGVRRACGPSADRMRARYLQLFQSALAAVKRAGGVRGDLPLDDLTLIYTGSLHGLLRGWLLDGCKGRLGDRARLLLSVFIDGAGSRPPAATNPAGHTTDPPPASRNRIRR